MYHDPDDSMAIVSNAIYPNTNISIVEIFHVYAIF